MFGEMNAAFSFNHCSSLTAIKDHKESMQEFSIDEEMRPKWNSEMEQQKI